ncbi:MAG: type II toxin-antitoxin system HicB family antitoxin [Acidobacteria bacterium]|nr:type II toxin-antitoxin system HicB family antitoxin [Acidobacteriota bacterium]
MNEATIRLRIEKLAGGRFLATSPDVPGLVAEGRSVAEATEIAQGLARKIAESCIEHGDPVPSALTRLYEQETETGLDLLVPVSVP